MRVRPRLNEGRRRLIWEYLDKIHGHKCVFCGTLEQLEIHRPDPLKDYSLSNALPACKSCNLSKRIFPNDTSSLVCVSVQNGAGDENELEKNRRTEPAWVEFVTANLGYGPVPKDRLTGNSAHQIGISVATVSRHWKKYASDLGPFHIYRPNQGTSLLVELRKVPSK